MKKSIWLLPVFLILLVASCMKENLKDETIVLMGTEMDVKSIDQVLPDTLLNFLVDSSKMAMDSFPLQLPTGINPPDIQDEYMFFLTELYATNSGLIWGDGDTICFRFNNQQNRIAEGDIKVKGADKKHIEKAYIQGSGDQFAVYFTVKFEGLEDFDNPGQTYWLERGYTITGTMTDSKIEKAVVACVNLDSDKDGLKDQIYVYRVKTNNPKQPFGAAIKKHWN